MNSWAPPVLEMDVENVLGEFACGFDRVDHLPGEMRRVHLDTDVWRVVKRAEQRSEGHGVIRFAPSAAQMGNSPGMDRWPLAAGRGPGWRAR